LHQVCVAPAALVRPIRCGFRAATDNKTILLGLDKCNTSEAWICGRLKSRERVMKLLCGMIIVASSSAIVLAANNTPYAKEKVAEFVVEKLETGKAEKGVQ
jgi:hypothetical protein